MKCLACGSSYLNRIANIDGIPRSAQPFVESKPDPSDYHKYKASISCYQCSLCSHVQIDADLVPYYKDVVTAASLSSTLLADRDAQIECISKLLNHTNPSIYEIGAFKGQYLSHLKNHGYTSVFGLENSLDSVAFARSNGIQLDQGYLLDTGYATDKYRLFDIILCFNFLEHIPDPFAFIQIILSSLAADICYLYFTMPSFKYIQDQDLLQEFVPDHVSYFTPSSLRALFGRCNLEICSLDSINNDNDLQIIARYERIQSAPISLGPFHELIDNINSILYSSNSSGLRASFWGAGHRSLTLISQIKNQLVSSIIDSAPFKHGRYCPDTGLRIISPLAFFDNPSEVLFLSLPGIYADEVIHSIRASNVHVDQIYLIDGNHIQRLSI